MAMRKELSTLITEAVSMASYQFAFGLVDLSAAGLPWKLRYHHAGDF